MKLNEKLKQCRENGGLSQEKIAELVGVSRQAVTKWENGQSSPSSNNLTALASIYKTSLDELVDNKNKGEVKAEKILHSNLTLIAIILQASSLNICIQPMLTAEYGLPYTALLLFKLLPLLACSIWMAYNLKYEKNSIQFRKNVKFELGYCLVQVGVILFALYSQLTFVGTLLIIFVTIIYIFVINPKYMNRTMVVKKNRK